MALSIGVDVGGTKVLGGVVDDDGKILTSVRKETPKVGGAELNKVIAEVILELKSGHSVDTVGITGPGFISSDRQTVLAVPNINNWDGINVHDQLFELTGINCVIENDANAAAWGEAIYGAAKGISHSIILTVGTGIGGGLVINNELYRGAYGCASEFGHMRLVPDGILCGCGATGCLEQYASGSALMRITREAIEADSVRGEKLLKLGGGSVGGINGGHITEAAKSGDPLAIQMLEITGRWLGAGIATLSVVLDPRLVVIGGGVVEAGDLLLGPARKAMEEHLPFLNKHPHPSIVAAKMGNEAGLVGVADLARR